MGADEVSPDKLELLVGNLLSQVVLLVQLTFFIYWWLQLWRQLHTPSFIQNKQVSHRRREEKWSAICYINGGVSHSCLVFFWEKAKYNPYMSYSVCQCKYIALFNLIYPLMYPVGCTVLCECYSISAFCHILFINQSETESFNIRIQWMKPKFPLLFYRQYAVCWCLPNLHWSSLSKLVLSNRKCA